MKKYSIIFFLTILLFEAAHAAIYECTYKNKKSNLVTSSFNTINFAHENYSELLMAQKSGNCRELYVKKYFIDATSCNIQFYKSNKQIGNITCQGNKQEPLKKLKAIARRDFGYMGK